MGNFTKLGNTAGVIFTAMWAWTERPEVIKSHAWRIRGFTRWSPAEIRIYPTPLRHRAIRQVRMSFCVLFSFSFFTASAAGGQIENKMMIKVHFFYPTEAKMRHDADETQISQHTQVMGRQAWTSQNACTSPHISNAYHRLTQNQKHSSKHVSDSLLLPLSLVISPDRVSNIPEVNICSIVQR